MKKAVAVMVLLSVFLSVTSATASRTRVNALGNVNLYVKDDANISLFPSAVTRYPNLVNLESSSYYPGYGETRYGPIEGGILLDLGRTGVFGFFINRFPQDVPYGPDVDPYFESEVDSKLDLFYGKSLEGLDLGLNFYWLGRSREEQDADPEDEEYKKSLSVLGWQVGMGKRLAKGDVEGTIWYETTDFTDEEDGETLKEPEGYRSIGIRGRVFQQITEGFTLVPFGEYVNIGRGYTSDISESNIELDYKYTNLTGGFGFNLAPQKHLLVILHVGVALSKQEWKYSDISEDIGQYRSEYDSKYTDFPFYGFGIEAELAHWLTARFGARKLVQSMEHEYRNLYETEWERREQKGSQAPGQMYLGAGFSFRDWVFDVQVAESFLHYGPNFLSGYDDRIFSRVSVTRRF